MPVPAHLTPLRRALLALLTVAGLLVPVVAVPAAAAGVPAPGCEMAESCPLAAAASCQAMRCCVAPATPSRPLPLDEAAPVAGPHLLAPPPVAVALVVPFPPRPWSVADDRPLHGAGGSAALYTLHASFLI